MWLRAIAFVLQALTSSDSTLNANISHWMVPIVTRMVTVPIDYLVLKDVVVYLNGVCWESSVTRTGELHVYITNSSTLEHNKENCLLSLRFKLYSRCRSNDKPRMHLISRNSSKQFRKLHKRNFFQLCASNSALLFDFDLENSFNQIVIRQDV